LNERGHLLHEAEERLDHIDTLPLQYPNFDDLSRRLLWIQ